MEISRLGALKSTFGLEREVWSSTRASSKFLKMCRSYSKRLKSGRKPESTLSFSTWSRTSSSRCSSDSNSCQVISQRTLDSTVAFNTKTTASSTRNAQLTSQSTCCSSNSQACSTSIKSSTFASTKKRLSTTTTAVSCACCILKGATRMTMAKLLPK